MQHLYTTCPDAHAQHSINLFSSPLGFEECAKDKIQRPKRKKRAGIGCPKTRNQPNLNLSIINKIKKDKHPSLKDSLDQDLKKPKSFTFNANRFNPSKILHFYPPSPQHKCTNKGVLLQVYRKCFYQSFGFTHLTTFFSHAMKFTKEKRLSTQCKRFKSWVHG